MSPSPDSPARPSRLEAILRVFALLAALAALALPALSLTAPLIGEQHWTLFTLFHSLHAIRQTTDQLRNLVPLATPAEQLRLNQLLRFATAVPVLAILAAACAPLAVIAYTFHRRRALLAAAAIGLLATSVAIAACASASRLAQAQLDRALRSAPALHFQAALRPESALYVLAFAFLTLLLLPLPPRFPPPPLASDLPPAPPYASVETHPVSTSSLPMNDPGTGASRFPHRPGAPDHLVA